MSTYPLDEPHIEALRSVCALAIATGNPPGFLEGLAERADEPAKSAAQALSRSDLSASLVRDLLARAGVDNVERVNVDADQSVSVSFGGKTTVVQHCSASATELISALANLAPGDKEGAMRALREVGR